MNEKIKISITSDSLPTNKNKNLIKEFVFYFNSKEDNDLKHRFCSFVKKPAGILTTTPNTKTIHINPDNPRMVDMTKIREFVCHTKPSFFISLRSNLFETIKNHLLNQYKGDSDKVLYIIQDLDLSLDKVNVNMEVKMKYCMLEINEI